MKNIFSYIKESDKYGDPDHIKHHNKEYSFDSKYARAYIFNKKERECIWSEPGETHNDILFDLTDDIRNKFDLYTSSKKPIRYVEYLAEPENAKINKCGRIWVIPNNKSKHRKFDVYIAWWNELSESEFKDYNKKIINQYNKDFNNNLESYIAIDNNGKFVLVEPDGKEVTIEKRDERRKQDVEILKRIHLATQKEKQDFFKGFKTYRDDSLQKKRYNHTDSKTAAEFHNNFTKRYDFKSGRYEWGEKIGDSLIDNYTYNKHTNMKNLIDYILENRVVNFGTANPNYGQCVILAGGAASGKGFIQNKITITGKVFDVDELKKKYQKMAKAGIFKDDKEYDLTNPDDVAELHQKVKETGLKSKERNSFWGERQRKGDKHSSGLLPNVIFDMVSDDIKDVEEVVSMAKGNGYFVTLVWVVCNKDTAVTNNTLRGIGDKSEARKVPDEILNKGHNGAYKTITDLFDNKYPEVNEFIDIAWCGFSAGHYRELSPEFAGSPIVKVKKKNNKFVFDKAKIDSFLKTQQPVDYNRLNKDLKKSGYAKEKAEKFVEMNKDVDNDKLK